MERPRPTPVVHFTRVEHLPSILANGLLSDSRAQAEGLLTIEIGNTGIKVQRARRQVPIWPGGSVADYVPFYFAPRSPMLYAIHRGNVPTYQEGCDRLVYLVTSLEALASADLSVLVTDRNAVLEVSDFQPFDASLPDEFIDWELMRSTYWKDTPEFPDRRERRMAECLVHDGVPWEVFAGIAAKSGEVADEVRQMSSDAGFETRVHVRPEWYF